MTKRDLDDAVAEMAAPQHGAFSRSQATECGASESFVERRLDSGAWVRCVDSVYRLPGLPQSWEQRLHVAVLAMPHAVISYAAAAALHALDGFGPGPVLVTVPHGRTRRPQVATVRQATDLDPAHRVMLQGLPVTTVARTIVDLAGFCRRDRIERILDDAVVAGRVTLNQVIEVFDHVARPGKRGVRNLRVVLAARAPGYVPPESALESLLLKVLRRGGLPRPVLQYPFPGRPPGEARVDAAYPSSHVLIEADGRRWHTRVDDFVRDRGRDNEVVALGWRVLRFTWEDLRHRPDRVCAVVRRAAFPDAA